MPGTLSLTPTVEVFPCLNCGQTINTSIETCPFCHTSIDPAAAEQAARLTSRVSQACSDASYLKIMLGILIPFALSTFIPFLGLVGLVGSVFVKYAIPLLAIRWWIKYGRVKTIDPDFSRARKTTMVVSSIAVVVLFVFHVHIGTLSL